jgi:hypothetical protein
MTGTPHGPRPGRRRPPAWIRQATGTTSRRNERAEEMFRTVNGEKTKRLTPKAKTAVTILWIVLVCAALAFIAFAGHI